MCKFYCKIVRMEKADRCVHERENVWMKYAECSLCVQKQLLLCVCLRIFDSYLVLHVYCVMFIAS